MSAVSRHPSSCHRDLGAVLHVHLLPVHHRVLSTRLHRPNATMLCKNLHLQICDGWYRTCHCRERGQELCDCMHTLPPTVVRGHRSRYLCMADTRCFRVGLMCRGQHQEPALLPFSRRRSARLGRADHRGSYPLLRSCGPQLHSCQRQ